MILEVEFKVIIDGKLFCVIFTRNLEHKNKTTLKIKQLIYSPDTTNLNKKKSFKLNKNIKKNDLSFSLY